MKRRATWLLGLAASAVAVAAAPGVANAEELPRACELVSLHQVSTIVGLPHAQVLRDASNLDGTEGLEPSMIPGVVETQCNLGLWRGSKPIGPAASAKKARAGQGAQVGVRTWAPNETSINVGDWVPSGFDEATAAILKARWKFVYEGAGKAKSLNPKGEGYSGAGAVVKLGGLGKGLEASVGCWWDAQDQRIICIDDQEAEGKPVVHHLNALADKIVQKFLGAP